MKNCPNCEKPLTESDKYCAACGQPTFDLHQSFFKLLHHITHEMLDIDGRLMQTIKGLLFKPGFVSAQYRAGKRICYTPPLRMYLVTSLLFFVLMALLKTQTDNDRTQISIFMFLPGMLEQIPKLMFVLLPIYAGLLQLFQRQSHYIFNVVFAVHIHTFWYFLLMLALPLQAMADKFLLIKLLQSALFIYLLLYPLLAIKRFYGQSWIRSCVVALTSFLLYVTCISLGLETIALLLEYYG